MGREPKEAEDQLLTTLCIKCHSGRNVFVNVNVLNTSVRDLAAMVTAAMVTVDTFESHIDHFVFETKFLYPHKLEGSNTLSSVGILASTSSAYGGASLVAVSGRMWGLRRRTGG